MSRWEMWQHRLLEESNQVVQYKNSMIGKELASETYCSIHSILDYSSVAKNCVLYTSCFQDYPCQSIMFKFLAHHTKKRLSKFQSEVDFHEIAHVHAPACKSYSIDVLSENQMLEFINYLTTKKVWKLNPTVKIKRISLQNVFASWDEKYCTQYNLLRFQTYGWAKPKYDLLYIARYSNF